MFHGFSDDETEDYSMPDGSSGAFGPPEMELIPPATEPVAVQSVPQLAAHASLPEREPRPIESSVLSMGSSPDESYMPPAPAYRPPPRRPIMPVRPGMPFGLGAAPTIAAPQQAQNHPVEDNPEVTERSHLLGFSLIASSLGAVAGLRIGGIYGGVAGTLFAGAAVNGYRAALHAVRRNPEGDREALISATYGLISAGLGGYIAFKSAEWSKTDKPSERPYSPPLIANKGRLKAIY